VHGQVCERLPAQYNLALSEIRHESRIGRSIQTGSSIDPHDPELSELPFSLTTVAILELKGPVYRVFSYGIDFTASTPIAFCLSKKFLAAASGSHAIGRSWHFSFWLNQFIDTPQVSRIDETRFSELALPFLGHLSQDVTPESLLPLDFPRPGAAKTLLGAAMCFHLWHVPSLWKEKEAASIGMASFA
jgi:hypothetical protein